MTSRHGCYTFPIVVRTYTVINPVPSLVGLLERTFGVQSWPISTFGGIVPPLTDPTVLSAAVAHDEAIIVNHFNLGIPDDGSTLPTSGPIHTSAPI